jgi:gamma-glutamylputrescine oxidase
MSLSHDSLAADSYYETGVVRPPPSEPLRGDVHADVGIVGAGYAGLSAALELATRGYSVVVLEAQTIGWGASGRNGGQVLVGFAGQDAIEHQLTRAEARQAWDLSVEAVRIVQHRILAHRIDCDYVAGHISLATNHRRGRDLAGWAERLDHEFGYPVRALPPDEISGWVSSSRYHSGVFDPQSGHLHPLKYCLGLAAAARAAGVRIIERTAVVQIEGGGTTILRTERGRLHCRFAVLAGNAYLAQYGAVAPKLGRRIQAVSTYMIATQPMSAARAAALIPSRAAASDTNFILDYFRLSADDRLLFGGGDAYSGPPRPGFAAAVRHRMLKVFPQLEDLAIDHSWGGYVDATANSAPDFGRLGDAIYYLQGFSGHGVALAGLAGRLAAEVIAGQAERFDVLAKLRHTSLPQAAWARNAAVDLAVLYFRLRDALS